MTVKCKQHPKAKPIKVAMCVDDEVIGNRLRCPKCYLELAWLGSKDKLNHWIKTGRILK